MIWSHLPLWADCPALLSLSSQAFIPAPVTEEELAEAAVVQELIQRMHLARFKQCSLLSFLHLVFCTRVRKRYLEVNEQSHQVHRGISLFTLHLNVIMTSLIKPALSGKQL